MLTSAIPASPPNWPRSTRWPDGSVQHALISFLATMPGNGRLTVSFTDQVSGHDTGAMNRASMLARNWGAEIEVTQGTTRTAVLDALTPSCVLEL